jgi:hypothetical protein
MTKKVSKQYECTGRKVGRYCTVSVKGCRDFGELNFWFFCLGLGILTLRPEVKQNPVVKIHQGKAQSPVME